MDTIREEAHWPQTSRQCWDCRQTYPDRRRHNSECRGVRGQRGGAVPLSGFLPENNSQGDLSRRGVDENKNSAQQWLTELGVCTTQGPDQGVGVCWPTLARCPNQTERRMPLGLGAGHRNAPSRGPNVWRLCRWSTRREMCVSPSSCP